MLMNYGTFKNELRKEALRSSPKKLVAIGNKDLHIEHDYMTEAAFVSGGSPQ